MDLNQKLNGVEITDCCTIRPNDEKDAPKKSVTIKFRYDECTVEDVLLRAATPIRINWQNANRKNFDGIMDGSIITIFVKPVGERGKVDTEAALLARFFKLSPEKQAEFLDKATASTV